MKGSLTTDSGETVSSNHQSQIFNAVMRAYRAIRNAHPLCANNPDTDAPTRSHPLSFVGIEFAVDVELATNFALKDQPDEPELHRVWIRLVAGDDNVAATRAQQVIRSVAPVYDARNLCPYEYFRKIRRKRVEK